MVLVLGAWIYLGLLFSVLGAGTAVLLAAGGASRIRALFLPWLGIAFTSLATSLWSLAAPVGPTCHATLLGVGLLFLLARPVRVQWVGCLRELAGVGWGAGLTLLWLSLVLAFAATDGPVYNLDSGRYHFQNLLWAKSHPVVPGLANLHARYGFGSSWYLVHALLEWGPLVDRTYHVFNGFVVLLLCGLGITSAFRVLRGKALGAVEWGAFGTLAFFGFYFDLFRWLYLSTLTPDLPANAFVIVTFLAALDVRDQNPGPGEGLPGLLLVAALASQAFAIRPSGAYLALVWVLLAASLWLRKVSARSVAASGVIALLLALPTLVRSYVLSGWPLFPSPLLGVLQPDWQYPPAAARVLMDDGIRRFAFLEHMGSSRPQISVGEAFWAWLGHELRHPLFIPWVLGGIALAWVALRRGRGEGLLNSAICCGALGAAGAWMATSPHFRYGFGYVCVAFSVPLALLLAGHVHLPRVARLGARVLLALFLANATVKTMGVSVREQGVRYPLAVAIRMASEWRAPLLGLPLAVYDAMPVEGGTVNVVRWEGSYATFGRFSRQVIQPRPTATTDAHGVQLLTGDATHNAAVAGMTWAAPLPAVTAIPPGLKFRGATLRQGFVLEPNAP